MKEPRVYKNSPAILIVIVMMFLLLMSAIVFGAGFESSSFLFPIAAFGLFIFGLIFVANSSKVVITDEEITAQNLFGARTLRWSEIHRVSGRGYGIKLHNYDGDVTVAPSSGLPGYEQVVDSIGEKRPDLFNPQEYSEMRRGLLPFVMGILVILFIVGAGAAFAMTALDSPGTPVVSLAPLAVFVVIAFVFGMTILSIPQVVTLDGYSLNLKYLFSERTLRADEIKYIQFWYTQSRNGKHYFIALHQTNGKQIHLSGLGISLPIAYLVLKNWHQNNLHGQSANIRPPTNNIAPNWSDNSGR